MMAQLTFYNCSLFQAEAKIRIAFFREGNVEFSKFITVDLKYVQPVAHVRPLVFFRDDDKMAFFRHLQAEINSRRTRTDDQKVAFVVHGAPPLFLN